MSFFCDLKTLKNIYFAHIHSHIAFGACLYGATKQSNLEAILIQQKKAIRIILNLNFNATVKEHFKQLKILTVYGQYIYDCILITKSNQSKQFQGYEPHKYNTRNKREIITEHHKLRFFEKKT